MKISISALSIAYGLTPEALRYYEEKGLLSPDRTASSGFRRFSIADVQRLGIIKSLQRQGFSLDEIKRIMTHCPLADLLRDCDRLSMQPRLCAGSAGYLIDFDSVSALWASVPKLPILKALIDALPLTSYCTIIPPALLTGGSAAARVGIVAPAEFMHVIHADFSQMRLSAGPQTIRTIFELRPPEESSLQPIVDLNREFLQAHHLTPVCEGYTRQYAWFVDDDGQMRHYSELIIPVMAP